MPIFRRGYMIPKKNTAKDLWKPRRRIEFNYRKALKEIVRKMNSLLVGVNSASEIVKILKKFTNSTEFKKYTERTAMKMVTSLFSDAGKTWREAARVNSRGRIIYESLKNEMNGPIGIFVNEQIKKNAELIKSMPLDIAESITDYTSKQSFEGRRAEDIATDLLKEIPIMSEKKANLIARTEVAKTNTELIRARCELTSNIFYIWKTSKDQRVRNSHDHMDDVIVFWNEPPNPEKLAGEKDYGNYYHAGCFPNCRCYPSIVDIEFISWPHKVYHNGAIQTMTRKQFEEIVA